MKYEEYKKIRDAFNFLIVYGFDYEDISLIDNYLRSFNKEYGKASNEFWNCYSWTNQKGITIPSDDMTAEEYNLINANIETIYTISNGGYIDIRKIIFNHLCKNNSRYKKYRDEIESMNQEWFENYLEANDYNFDPYNDKDDAMVLEKHRQGFYIDVLNEYNSIIQKIKMDAYRHEQDIGFGIDKRSKYSVEIALKIQKLINEELLNIPSKDDEQKLVYHDLDRYGFDNKILGPYKKYWKYYDEDGALLENVY